MELNIFAAILTGVASLFLGFIWYGPLFSKLWMKEVGLKEEDLKAGPGVGYFIAFLTSTFLGGATSYIVHLVHPSGLKHALLLGVLLALGYVATTFATNYIFARKSIKLYLIDTGYQTLLVVIATVIAHYLR